MITRPMVKGCHYLLSIVLVRVVPVVVKAERLVCEGRSMMGLM